MNPTTKAFWRDAAIGVLLITAWFYLMGSFANASFDISTWAAFNRTMLATINTTVCAICSLVIAANHKIIEL